MIQDKRNAVVLGISGSAMLLAAPPVLADWALNMTQGVTQTSRDVYGLHMTIFWITVVIGVLVFGAMFYSVFSHRKSRGVRPARFHHNTAVEVVWTVIPLLILVGMAVPATGVLIDMEDTTDAEMSIKVTGYQWRWGYEYVGEGVQFISSLDENSVRARRKGSGVDPSSVDNYLLSVDQRLVVPTDTKIRFLITSADVIHSWWVPDLGWKKDAIPGYVNETWTEIQEPGVYRGKCAELCGRGHGFMPVVIEALEPAEFREWLAARKDANGAASANSTGSGTAALAAR